MKSGRHAAVVSVALSLALASSLGYRGVLAAEPTPSTASMLASYARPETVPSPDDNRPSADRERLGRTLFFDPRLSSSGFISCASCHNPGFAWGDGLPRAIGHGMQRLDRRTPTILNLAWAPALFWDGRAGSLEEQALAPVQAPTEMNQPIDGLLLKLRALPAYVGMFDRAYPGEGITPATIGKAIAAFERTTVSAPAPFDRWIAGDDGAIGDDAKRGFAVFNQDGRCAQCHSGWRFTDDGFYDIGVVTADRGRGARFAEIPAMQHTFKTPTLRDVDRRGPYMHNGSVASLDAVVELYDRGGLAHRESLSTDIKPLRLRADQKRDLVAFLKTLTSDDRPVQVPTLPY